MMAKAGHSSGGSFFGYDMDKLYYKGFEVDLKPHCAIINQWPNNVSKQLCCTGMADAMKNIDALEPTTPCTAATPAPATPKPLSSIFCKDGNKKDSKMFRNEDSINIQNDVEVKAQKTDVARSREYLRDRVYSISDTKYEDLAKQFGMRDDPAPRTFTELLARLTSGKYIIADDRKDKRSYDPLNYVTWRDPAVKQDEAGFDIAKVAKDKARVSALDIVETADPAAGLAAVQTFEAWTYVAPKA